jgi:hypothetical protein
VVSSDPEHQWAALTSNRGLYQYLTSVFGETINPYVGTKLFPKYVWRLGLSDRAFSVVLRARKGLMRDTATFTLNGSPPLTVSDWTTKYGDHYIDSIISGITTTIVWTFTPELPDPDQFKVKSNVAALFASPTILFEVGCANLAALATRIPCQAYFYDAYFNETQVEPSAVISTLDRLYAEGKGVQVLSVGLKPYNGLPGLLQAAPGIVPRPSDALSLSTLKAVRKDTVDFVFQAAKRCPNITPIQSNDAYRDWMWAFSQDEFNKGVADPSGSHGAATGIAHAYNLLFSGQTPPVPEVPRTLTWNINQGDEQIFERHESPT